MRTWPTGTVVALALISAGCGPPRPADEAGISLVRHYPVAKATVLAAAKEPLDSAAGGAVSYSFLGAVGVVGEVLDMELEDGAGLLQSRLYFKLNLPVLPYEDFQLAVAPLVGLAYTDLSDAPGWSIDHASLLAGVEATAVFWAGDADGVLLNLRWAYTDWELGRPGRATKVMSTFEISLGYVHQF